MVGSNMLKQLYIALAKQVLLQKFRMEISCSKLREAGIDLLSAAVRREQNARQHGSFKKNLRVLESWTWCQD